MTREFADGSAFAPDGMPRRDFIKLLSASMALAGLGGCVRAPDEEIQPYVNALANVVPGVPLHYATAMTLDGFATGLLVESNDGRPTKIEGNPAHSASLGAAGIFEQASVLELYDPRRARSVRRGSRRSDWNAVRSEFAPAALAKRVGATGSALALVLEPTASPLVATLLDAVRTRFPDVQVFYNTGLASASFDDASDRAFGPPLLPQYDFTAANTVVSFNADPLASGPFHLRHARDFSNRRRRSERSRLYVAETCPSPTGTLADSRLALSPTGMERVAAALLRLVVAAVHNPVHPLADFDGEFPLNATEQQWVQGAADALVRQRGESIVVASAQLNVNVQVLTHALNEVLANAGRTVWYTSSPIIDAGQPNHRVENFAKRLDRLESVVVLDTNVCYNTAGTHDIERRFRQLKHSLYLGSFANETARASGWHVPATHYLESWGVERSYDGALSIVQPLIAPMYGGRTVSEMLALLAGIENATPHTLVRNWWSSQTALHAHQDDHSWRQALQNGVVEGSASQPVVPKLKWSAVQGAYREALVRTRSIEQDRSRSIEVTFVASRTLHDGRFADNPWLQELPDPITKLTWDNAALVSPETALQLHVADGDLLRLESGARFIELPALLVAGHARNTVTLSMGYGRQGGEGVAKGVGVNVNPFRDDTAGFQLTGVRAWATGRTARLAVTQAQNSIEERAESVLGKRPAAASELPAFAPKQRRPLTLYEPPPVSTTGFGADQWAMTIDLDQCTGCSACVVACQSENNIPVVGKQDVLKGREMHWLRIDRYVQEDEDQLHVDVQPMLCQHCEKAPCEYVCPVNATVHSDDGLNEMIYNRCVGTRFCSNNCPYKVRRFNWFEYNGSVSEPEQMQKNPQVSVRSRGVMEKCTFCVQRIRAAQLAAELAGEPYTGPVQTACEQTCPTQAIVFGSLTAPNSAAAALTNHPRAFSALEELGTVPRVRYLARVLPERV